MGISAWFFAVIAGPAFLACGVLVVLGVAAAYPPTWNETIRKVAQLEIQRRFEGFGPRTQTEFNAAARMYGRESSFRSGSSEKSVSDALQTVSGYTEIALEAELNPIRNRLGTRAAKRQVRLVSNISSIRVASYLWPLGNLVSKAEFAVAGVKWLCSRMAQFPEQPKWRNTHLTLIGVVSGLMVAGIAQVVRPESAPFRWLDLAGRVMLFTTIVVATIQVLQCLRATLVSRFGPVNQWSMRGVRSGSCLILFIVTACYLIFSGDLANALLLFGRWLESLDPIQYGVRWVSVLVMNAAVIAMLLGIYKVARNRAVILSDRLIAITFAPIFFLMLVMLSSYAFGIPGTSFVWLAKACVWSITILGALAAISKCAEWLVKYRKLKALDRTVRQKGFRWWALLAWMGWGLVVIIADPLLSAISPLNYDTVLITLHALYSIISVVWILAFVPGMIVTWLYMRRVSKTYEAARFELAPPHPYMLE